MHTAKRSTPLPTPPEKIITVSGLHPGVGKTLLAEHVLDVLDDAAAVKITIDRHGYTTVTDDRLSIMVEGKDTFRLQQHGAKKVVWVQTTERDLGESLSMAFNLVAGCSAVVIEGNSIVKHIDPNAAFFVCDEAILTAADIKRSRTRALKKAHVIIYNMRDEGGPSEGDVEAACRKLNGTAQFVAADLTESDRIQEIVRNVLRKKNIPCSEL